MYRKIIVSKKQLTPNKNSLNWLNSKRRMITFKANSLEFDNIIFDFNNMSNIEMISYKSLAFFNLYSIFLFKYDDLYYQIGVNNTEKRVIENFFKNIEVINQKVKAKDIIYFFVVISTIIWLIYNFIKWKI